MNGQQTWLITGGTGSLGTALTQALLSEGHKVRVFARDEHRHDVLEKAIPKAHKANLSCLLGAVEDRRRLRRAVRGVEYVIHAAAQKVIDRAEYNPIECIQTNTLGSINVLEACIDAKVKRAVLVSTDKARAPSTLYGATKLCAERAWLAANRYRGSETGLFSACAYGNVWGSRGSVLQAFAEQAQHGFLTLTDIECTRFHITIEQAVRFVRDAVDKADPGTLWIPKIPSYRVGDLATAFESIYEIKKPRVVLGLRPAEKRHESLVSENEWSSVKESIADPGNPNGGRYVLEPGKVHRSEEGSYTSGKNSWKLTIDQLEREVLAWASS